MEVECIAQPGFFVTEFHFKSLCGGLQEIISIIPSQAQITLELRFRYDCFASCDVPILAKPLSEFLKREIARHEVASC